MIKEKNVGMTGVPETSLLTLRIRANETMRSDALIQDVMAVEILRLLNVDKQKTKVSAATQAGTIARTIIFDRIINNFLDNYPQGIIVNIGCGLDSRNLRIPIGNHLWFDLDVNEIINLRTSFFEESEHYKMIAKSMLDYSWMDDIPANSHVLFISEGVMPYFDESSIMELFCKIAERFNSSEIVFDVISKWASNNHKRHPDVKKYQAPFKWGIDNSLEIETWHHGLSFVNELSFGDYVKDRWPLFMRIAMKIFPSIKRSCRVVHFKIN